MSFRRTFVGALFASALALHAFLPVAVQAEVVPYSLEQTIQQSGLIFVGEVISKEARWNDNGSLIVTDYELTIDQILLGENEGETIRLTFAGGELPKETHQVSDVPEMEVGEVVLLMVEESDTPLLCPLTGMYHGKFSSESMRGYRSPIVVDGKHGVITDDKGNALTFRQFTAMVSELIPVAKSLPQPDRRLPRELQKYAIKDLPAKRYVPPTGEVGPRDGALPAVHPPIDRPLPPNRTELKPFTKERTDGSDDDTFDIPLGFEYQNLAATVPIVFSPWPEDYEESIRFHDQYALGFWNEYVDMYRVSEPTDDWAFGNNRFDMAGFPSNAEMIDQFGQGWGSGTLAVCWRRIRSSSGLCVEADIAVNPAYNWTTDDFATYFSSSLYNLDRTLTHEVGHSWGLEHQFNALSVMNYSPKKYRAYNVIYADDSLGFRDAYPNRTVNVSDLGLSLFYSSSYQDYDDSTINSRNLFTGEELIVNDFVIENIGTETMTPEVDWYLCPTLHSWEDALYISSTSHSSLAAGEWYETSRTLTIPSSVPNGTYYLGCVIANSDDEIDDNDSSWLDRSITITSGEPPENDDWADTIGIPNIMPTTEFGTNENATEEFGEPDINPAGATVWWYFLSPSNGKFRINTFGSDYDTMIHVYTGFENGLSGLELVAENDDTPGEGLLSEVTFNTNDTQFYEVRVSGYNGDVGNIVLNVILLGDGNGDNTFDFGDITPFILAMTDREQFEEDFPGIDADVVLDFNNDDKVDFGDIAGFVDALTGN